MTSVVYTWVVYKENSVRYRAGATHVDVVELDEDADDFAAQSSEESKSSFYPIELEDDSQGRVSLRKAEVCTLRERSWTPQLVVDFYMAHLQQHLTSNGVNDVAILSSCWFTKLSGRFNEVATDRPYELDSDRIVKDGLRGWGAGRRLFDKFLILLPVIFCNHWSLIMIVRPGHVMSPGNTTTDVQKGIVHLDSLRGQHSNVDKCVRLYLFEEYVYERLMGNGEVIEHDENINVAWSRFMQGELFETVEPEVPQQTNHDDCGMFVIRYAHLICERVVDTFAKRLSAPDMMTFFTDSWFSPDDMEGVRMQVFDLVAEVAKKKHTQLTLEEIKEVMRHDIISSSVGECSL
jgi:Ulp1 family protease